MELPKKLESVLADVRHQSETGKHKWYEVVYHDGEKWCCYAGSDTFRDGESVKRWKYTKDCFNNSSQLEPPVMQKIDELITKYEKIMDEFTITPFVLVSKVEVLNELKNNIKDNFSA